MMRSIPSAFLLSAISALLLSAEASAQFDHLQCYKVKDNAAKAAYVATLTPGNAAFELAPGCTIKTPAKMICTGTAKSAVTPPPQGAPAGPDLGTFLCYKTKCPASEASLTGYDQFDDHVLAVAKTGWLCAPMNTGDCGDGAPGGAEECDDGGVNDGDGCSADCVEEIGYGCSGTPSVCETICGDGVVIGAESCDDGNTAAGDGCSVDCSVESGATCNGQPSVCNLDCGDGSIRGSEACDDGNESNGDGCSANCSIEPNSMCISEPSICVTF